MSSVLLCSTDNGNHLSQPHHGLSYLGAALRAAGHEVSVWDAALHHYPPEHLTATLEATRPDVVAVTSIGGYWQYRQLRKVSDAINASKHRDALWYVTGGHGPASDPAYFKRVTGCDTVFVGEGELTFTAACDNPLVHKGEAVMQGEPVDVDAVPRPAWDLFDVNVYRLQRYPRVGTTEFAMPVLSGRGCAHKCSFCFRLTPGYRAREPEAVADEIRWLQRDYGVAFVNLDDECAMIGGARTLALCEALRPLGVGWMCNGRLDIAARFPTLLPIMRDAGCRFINYGVEALSQPVLDEMNKRQSVDQIYRGVKATLEAGVSPGLNVMFGAPSDTRESLALLVSFLKDFDDHAQVRTVRPITPYPGTPLFKRAIAEGKIKDTADFYERLHVNSDLATVQWTEMTDDEFHAALYEANVELMRFGMAKRADRMADELRRLYIDRDASWRGFRHG
jgi:radical SAM superfamily enzyme YgiQ (UPF0313 family)